MLASLACLTFLLSACDEQAPGEDTAATVGGYEITLSELNQELAQSGVQDTENPAIRKAALEAIINRKLLAQMAQENELDRTPDYILKEQRMRDVLLAEAAVQSLSPQSGRSGNADVDAFLETNLSQGSARTVYAIEGLQFARPRQAAILAQLGAAASFEEVQRVLADADIASRGGNLTWDSATMPTDLVKQLAALPNGEPFLIPQGDGMVAGVIRDKRVLPLEPAQARAIAEAAVSQQTVRTRIMDWLEQARHGAEIEYGEGFAPDTTAGAAPTPAPATGQPTTAEPNRT